jgi:hypothetical protein
MITKKETVRLKHYCNHIFNRKTNRLYKASFGQYKEVIPEEGIFTIKRRGERHKFTEEELIQATQYVHTDNVKVSKHYAKHEKRMVW